MPLRPTVSSSGRNRDGLVTPGGSDLMAVVNRNADKLRVLQNVPESGSSGALDQFLATFVAQNSQVGTVRQHCAICISCQRKAHIVT
jgi:hypothetical protein